MSERETWSTRLVMQEVRGELGLGRIYEARDPYPFDPGPLEAKAEHLAAARRPLNGVRRLLEATTA